MASGWEDAAPREHHRSAAELAQGILALQAAHEQELEELRGQVRELQRQVQQLKECNADLENQTDTLRSEIAATGNKADHFSCSGESIFLKEKSQFIKFVTSVTGKGTDSPEYRQFYNFLLKCFTDADNNFDGRVGFLEFDTLIDAAAFLPRRFGFAPSTPELYATDFDRVKQRLALFNQLKPKKAKALNKQSGTYDYITFPAWLQYVMEHVTAKASALKDVNPRSQLESSEEDFAAFLLAACRSRQSPEYKELYRFQLKCFVDADSNLDGLVDLRGFSTLLELAAAPARRFGFVLPAAEMYASEELKLEAHAELFNTLDKDKTGKIAFDAWLEHIYNHICEKSAATFGSQGAVPQIEAAGHARSAPQCPWRV